MGSVTSKDNKAKKGKKTTQKNTKKAKKAIVYVGKDDAIPAVSDKEKQVILLSVPTPKKYIKKRRGRGGMVYDYVETNYVIGRLNATFLYNWNSEVVWQEIDREAGQAIVKVRLKARFADGTEVVKEAFGGSDIHRNKQTGKIIDLADCLKAAESDAIKKAASMLGIAWDVYAGLGNGERIEEEAEEETEKVSGGFLGGVEGVVYADDKEAEIIEAEEEAEEEMDEEKKDLIETTRIAIEKINGLDYKEFKKFLWEFQKTRKPPRHFVGKKFGNLSLSAGKKDDLWLLAKNMTWTISKFLEWKEREKEKKDAKKN